jgi:hypothetical protein
MVLGNPHKDYFEIKAKKLILNSITVLFWTLRILVLFDVAQNPQIESNRNGLK